MFSEKDLEQIKSKGISLEQLALQIKNFEQGFPFMNIIRPATMGDGILKVSDQEAEDYVKFYEEEMPKNQVYKFVPASGAASRMFKSLFSFMENFDGSEEAWKQFEKDQSFSSVYYFFKNIEQFAFYKDLKNAAAAKGVALDFLLREKQYVRILRFLLTSEGLNYGSLPKGLLKFHKYENQTRTPLEEHLVEGANYCKDADGKVDIHFTVSPEHKELFRKKVREAGQEISNQLNAEFKTYFSEQESYTDTIAVDLENQPFRNEDGTLLFRPAGHGALLENVNSINADIVFIKNIDNVVPDHLKPSTYRNKKLIAGVLLKFQQKIYNYLNQLEAVEKISENLLAEITNFVQKDLCNELPERFGMMHLREQSSFLFQKLNRPIRVCGMVKNEGEPGGGPFWTVNADGTVSLQIVESSQLNMDDAAQVATLQKSSHFNPVDLVCALKNFKGEKFDLLDFRDPQTGFITMKSQSGRDLKAQELPGLWNGAMADWNTIFVEVPVDTFNPVKIVNDLLRPQHQG